MFLYGNFLEPETMDNERIEQLKINPATLRVYASRLKLGRKGRIYETNCPFHDDTNPSFQIFKNAEGCWMWKCQSNDDCGSGNVAQFVQKFDKVSFPEALNRIEKEVANEWDEGKDRVDKVFQPIGQESKKSVRYPLDKYQKFETALLKSPLAREWLLKERGISFSTAQKFHLGFRQDLGKIAGDCEVADKGWIAIPTIRENEVVSIKYRSIVAKEFRRQPGMETELFNIETIDMLDTLYITEGEFDAIVLEQAGFKAVSIPNATTNLTSAMRDALMSAETRILAGDSDDAGQKAMTKLWNEFQFNTFRLQWPEGCKDANDTLMKAAGGNLDIYPDIVSGLTQDAFGRPMEHFSTIQKALLSANQTNLADHPDRLRAPWPIVDRMAILLPGSIMAFTATNSKQGKTVFQTNWTIYAARYHKEVVLQYQCELSDSEYANLVAAHVLRRDRNHLTATDYAEAAEVLAGVNFYVGHNPLLTKVDEVLDLIEAAIRRLGATVVVLDHIHFICRNEKNEAQAQANAMQRIKLMANRYGVKFIVVGQPRKADQTKRGKRIHMNDMKGSESLVSDASAIFVIHRDEIKIKDPDNPPTDDYQIKTEVHMLGARSKGDGPTYGELVFLGNIATFGSLAKDIPPEPNLIDLK